MKPAVQNPSMQGPLIVYGFSSSLSAGFYRGQLSYLRRQGYEVAVISSPGPEVEDLVKSEGIAYYPIPIRREISPKSDLISLLRIFRLLRKLKPAIANFGTPKAGLLGGLAGLAAGVPCRIYTLHGLRLETATGWKRRLLRATEWLSVHTAHTTVCVSESLRKRAMQLGLINSGRSTVLGSGSCNGVDVARFGEPDAIAVTALRRELGIQPGAPVIGFVGRFVRDKGIAELAMAFRTLLKQWPGLRLLLVGDFEDGDPVAADVKTYILSEPKILKTGFVVDPAPYYHLMSVFVLPTYREGLPGTALEAQAAGVPVVTTDATGAVDAIAHGVTGFVVPRGDAAALAQAIDQLLRDGGLRTRMAAAGKVRAKEQFSPQVIWDAITRLYANLTANRVGSAASLTAVETAPPSVTSASAD